jgi:hypothetical protein
MCRSRRAVRTCAPAESPAAHLTTEPDSEGVRQRRLVLVASAPAKTSLGSGERETSPQAG